MKLYLSTDNYQLSLSQGSTQSNISIPAKAGTTLNLEIIPDAELGGGATGVITVKPKGSYDAGVVARDLFWTPPTTSGAGYLFALDLNTSELLALFTGNKDSIPLMADITIVSGGQTHKTPTLSIVAARPVSTGDEGSPSQAPDLKAVLGDAFNPEDDEHWVTQAKVAQGIADLALPDALEFANLAAFPGTGSATVIYLAKDTGNLYRWTGSAYVQVGGSSGGGGGGEPTDLKTAYIRSNGNDSTGAIGSAPFLTGNAAYAAALASDQGVNGTLFDFGTGTFTIDNVADGLTINYRGAGPILTSLTVTGAEGLTSSLVGLYQPGGKGASYSLIDSAGKSLLLTATGGKGGFGEWDDEYGNSSDAGAGGDLTVKNARFATIAGGSYGDNDPRDTEPNAVGGLNLFDCEGDSISQNPFGTLVYTPNPIQLVLTTVFSSVQTGRSQPITLLDCRINSLSLADSSTLTDLGGNYIGSF